MRIGSLRDASEPFVREPHSPCCSSTVSPQILGTSEPSRTKTQELTMARRKRGVAQNIVLVREDVFRERRMIQICGHGIGHGDRLEPRRDRVLLGGSLFLRYWRYSWARLRWTLGNKCREQREPCKSKPGHPHPLND